MKTGEIEVLGRTLEILNASLTPPFQLDDYSDAGEDIRLRYRYLDLRRPEMQHRLRMRATILSSVRRYLEDGRLHRDRNADSHARNARRRTRLSRAESNASRSVLCIAAVAAAVQAAADDVGHGQVLSDRALLPRRRPARRPAARVHADRHRGIVRRRARHHGADRRHGERSLFAEVLRVDIAELPGAHVRRSDATFRQRQTGPAQPARTRRRRRPGASVSSSRYSTRRRTIRRVAWSRCARPVPDGCRARNSTDTRTSSPGTARKGLAYIKVNERGTGVDGLQSPILKFLPEPVIEGVLDRVRRGRRRRGVLRCRPGRQSSTARWARCAISSGRISA